MIQHFYNRTIYFLLKKNDVIKKNIVLMRLRQTQEKAKKPATTFS